MDYETYDRLTGQDQDAYNRNFARDLAAYDRNFQEDLQRRPRGCHWWTRWWHRRLRRIDREILLPQIEQRAALRARRHWSPYTQQYLNEVRRDVVRAWALHRRQPTSGHWRCACAPPSEDL